jgi:polysaccharide biosynthesis protein PslA
MKHGGFGEERTVAVSDGERQAIADLFRRQAANDEAVSALLDTIVASPAGHPVGGAPEVLHAHLARSVAKRLFDLALALSALVVLVPLLVVIALVIRLETRGPVIFCQDRIGLGNRTFRIFKFRTMHHDAGDATRITRVGRVIRANSMDELPQLINVIRGDMSIVGPRPHTLESRAAGKLFWHLDSRYWQRHAARPGLTGLAQIRGYRGATHREDDLHNRLQADLEYLERWSIWQDVKIVFATFRVIVHRNAV